MKAKALKLRFCCHWSKYFQNTNIFRNLKKTGTEKLAIQISRLYELAHIALIERIES